MLRSVLDKFLLTHNAMISFFDLESIQMRPWIFALVVSVITGCGPSDQERKANIQAELNPPASAYSAVVPCSSRDESCKYPRDLFSKRAEFKESTLNLLRKYQIEVPQWLFNGVEAELIRSSLISSSSTRIYASVCEPHHCPHAFGFLFREDGGAPVGLYQTKGGQFVWLGDPTVEERNFLCQQSYDCSEQRKNRGLARILNDLGFPASTDISKFSNCSNFKTNNSKVQQFEVCDAQPQSDCPFSNNARCMVDAEFINGEVRKLTFDYQYGEVNGDGFKNELDRRYGNSAVVEKVPDGVPMKTWSASWQADEVQITLDRLKGINVSGKPYDKLSIGFIVKTVPDPFSR
jgi:hypothetical protein